MVDHRPFDWLVGGVTWAVTSSRQDDDDAATRRTAELAGGSLSARRRHRRPSAQPVCVCAHSLGGATTSCGAVVRGRRWIPDGGQITWAGYSPASGSRAISPTDRRHVVTPRRGASQTVLPSGVGVAPCGRVVFWPAVPAALVSSCELSDPAESPAGSGNRET